MYDDLDTAIRVLKRVTPAAHAFRSWAQIAKRERISDDKLVRSLFRAAELAGGELTQIVGNRIVPTTLGNEFRELVERLLLLAHAQTEPIEVFRVAVSPGVDAVILTAAIADFGREFGGIASLKVSILTEGMVEAVESGSFAVGLTIQEAAAPKNDRFIEPPIPLAILIPKGHRLIGAEGGVDADHFSETDIVYLSPPAAERTETFLKKVPLANRIEIGCHATLHRLVAEGQGIGIEFAALQRRSGDSLVRLPAVSNIAPVYLGLVLPRKKPGEMTTSFIEAIKRAASKLIRATPSSIDSKPAKASPTAEAITA
jgi:DNA-binding transcriptional LysR family regulator